MKRIALVAALVAAAASVTSAGQLRALRDPREKHLRNVRQLTFGGQNAEAYWSFDGKKLVFQHQSGSMRADQIYVMNADGSGRRRVSTGKGRTTCAYFLPGNREVIFASTHAYSADPLPNPDHSEGYVWPIFPYYAIYRVKTDGTGLRPLFPKTVKPGQPTAYNAEATVSPDGKRIIFTSTRDGDLELYSMRIDGTGLRRLTHRLGYDGGAYYSPDSKMIVWRAHYPASPQEKEDYRELLRSHKVRPTQMEIWVANADGSRPRQVTRNGMANFAPFFTPDGRRIIFASNMADGGGRKFEIYTIKLDGTGLERITYGGEFDAFPMFSPDGKKLVWASNRHNSVPHETNVFVADWVP